MKYTIRESELKGLGYVPKIYQYDTLYVKEVVKGLYVSLSKKRKAILIGGWEESTENIMEFYTSNLEKIEKRFNIPSSFSGNPQNCVIIQLDTNTGSVQFRDDDLYFESFNKDGLESFYAKYPYETWRNEIYLFKEKMEHIVKEINILTKK